VKPVVTAMVTVLVIDVLADGTDGDDDGDSNGGALCWHHYFCGDNDGEERW
jgi:hypothetical protein